MSTKYLLDENQDLVAEVKTTLHGKITFKTYFSTPENKFDYYLDTCEGELVYPTAELDRIAALTPAKPEATIIDGIVYVTTDPGEM